MIYRQPLPEAAVDQGDIIDDAKRDIDDAKGGRDSLN